MRKLASLVLVVAATLAPVLTACTPTAPVAPPYVPLADAYPVGIRTETVYDAARGTAARWPIPAHAGRNLATTFYYPAAAGVVSTNDQAGAAPRLGNFPLVVFAHGFDVNPATYEPFLHTVAAHGYVVAAPTFPIEGHIAGQAPAQRSSAEMVNQMYDLSAVITAVQQRAAGNTWLHGTVNAADVAVVGHSDGAMTVAGMQLSSGYYDSRPRATVVLSGAALDVPGGRYGIRNTVPLLIEQADGDPYNNPANAQFLFDNAHGSKAYLKLTGGYHLWPLIGNNYIADLTRRAVLAHLDGQLKGSATAFWALASVGSRPGFTSIAFAR